MDYGSAISKVIPGTFVPDLGAATKLDERPNVGPIPDGVAGITQQAVPPGRSMTYEFVVNAPGTYWYHSHQDTSNQITRGLYGALEIWLLVSWCE